MVAFPREKLSERKGIGAEPFGDQMCEEWVLYLEQHLPDLLTRNPYEDFRFGF